MEIRGLIKNLIMAILDLVCVMQSGILHLKTRCNMICSSKVLQYPSGSQVGVNGYESTIWTNLVEVFCDFAGQLAFQMLDLVCSKFQRTICQSLILRQSGSWISIGI